MSVDNLESRLKTIALNVTRIRKAKGLSQDELAFRAEISRGYMGDIENQKSNLTLAKLIDIANTLEVSIEELLKPTPTLLADIDNGSRYEKLQPAIKTISQAASENGISHIFQDNGVITLQILLLCNLKKTSGQEAKFTDTDGRLYEIRSTSEKEFPQFILYRTIDLTRLDELKSINWILATVNEENISEIYLIRPEDITTQYQNWKAKLSEVSGNKIANPRLSLSFVKKAGKKIFP